MAVITYIARRSLVSGHVEGDEYAIEIPFNQWDDAPEKEESGVVTLSGKPYDRLHRIDMFYDAGTVPVDDKILIAQMREFLYSVYGGEEFTVDPLGTIAAPDQGYAVKLKGKHKETRTQNTYFSFSFRVRAV